MSYPSYQIKKKHKVDNGKKIAKIVWSPTKDPSALLQNI